ncbi:STAS domain-containing protein [Streptomyces sp. Go40/10]|uniref:STAS domain-containing protein n=1 Tax=Streptomyces sp. Go40/10 TaxID=2825844 RepID=UPI001E2F2CE1|nr:STAS domain-containing protein [Streptomyces sp. Go40/10]UFR00060.1 STAS domain-containing protein [Streptomyces sp. Go40/10]
MTHLPPSEFTLAVRHETATLTVMIGGELDYGTSGDLLNEVSQQLTAGQPPPADVRLDFRELTYIDSSGLTALLMIHRRTSALGATLHLDNRPARLERMLHLTDVLDHLTAPPTRAGGWQPEEDDGLTEAGMT